MGIDPTLALDIENKDKVILVRDSIKNWWFGLSSYARSTIYLSENARQVKLSFFLPLISDTSSPHEIILNKLIEIIEDVKIDDLETKIENLFSDIKSEFEKKKEHLLKKINETISNRFKVRHIISTDVREILKEWYIKLPENKKTHLPGGDADTIISACMSEKECTFEKF